VAQLSEAAGCGTLVTALARCLFSGVATRLFHSVGIWGIVWVAGSSGGLGLACGWAGTGIRSATGIGAATGIKLPSSARQEPPADDSERALDRVQFRSSPTDGLRTLRGVVVGITPRVVELQLASGSVRRISRGEVVSMQLLHHAGVAEADSLAAEGRFASAVEGFREVLRQDLPHWLKRYAAARRLQCLAALGQYRQAGLGFLALAEDDPSQIPWEVIPLIWTGTSMTDPSEDQVRQWLEGRSPIEGLLGASHGLTHPNTTRQSQAVLESLQNSGDSALAALAAAQLWRLQREPNEKWVSEAERKVAEFPAAVRAGPWLLLGRMSRQAGLGVQAADYFLQIPTLFPQQHDLVLLGLEGGYRTLMSEDPVEAEAIADWLLEQFPESAQADEIRSQRRERQGLSGGG